MPAKRLGQASQTMALGDQSLGRKENLKILSDMVAALTDAHPSNLWDEAWSSVLFKLMRQEKEDDKA